MGMLDRYRKKGGFIQLVNLIETTGTEKREKFLKMIAEENPQWEATIKSKMLSIDRLSKWNTSYLMEFIPAIPAMALACAIAPLSEDKKAIFLSALAFGDRRKVEDIMKEHKPNNGEIASSQIKIINEVRAQVASGKIKFEKLDPEMVIDEDIEDKLENGDFASSSPSAATNMDASVAAMAGAAPAGGNGAMSEDTAMLRRKLVMLTQENAKLAKENKDVKDKLEAIKSAVLKIA